MKTNYANFLTWEEFEKFIKNIKVLILPLGSFEQHGKHLVLGTDSIIVYKIAEITAKYTNSLVFPLLPYGISDHHLSFPGTITINKRVYVRFVEEIVKCLLRYGKKIVILNGHGGNYKSLKRIEKKYPNVYILNWWEFSQNFSKVECMHAGALETSIMMSISKKFVIRNKIEDNKIGFGDFKYPPQDISLYSKTGNIGIASTAKKCRGKKEFDIIIRKIINKIKTL